MTTTKQQSHDSVRNAHDNNIELSNCQPQSLSEVVVVITYILQIINLK